jgi:hypothetical protein
MSYHLRPALKSAAKLLLGIYSQSGCGKTMSALLVARGFVGEHGRICMIETESGRGEIYTDNLPGGYEVISMQGSYSPKEFGQAISAAEEAKVDALIIDSASHEWEGVNGVLDMAAQNQEAGKKGLLVWQIPKISHSRDFVLRLMGTPIPIVIICMRAKYPMEERQKQGGGKELVRSTQLEPKQSEDILYEMLAHGWIDKEHCFHITKYPDCFPAGMIEEGKPLSIETGRRIAEWAKGGSKKVPNLAPAECITVDQVIVLTDSLAEKGIAKDLLLTAAGKALGHEVNSLATLPAEFYGRAKTWIERAAT